MEAQPTGGAARVELCQVRDSSEALTAGCTYRPCKTLVCLFSGFLWFASAPPCFAHPFSGALGCCCRHHASVTRSPRCPNVSTHVLLHGYVEWDYLMDFSTGKWFLAAPHVTEVTFELFPLVLATLSRCVFTKKLKSSNQAFAFLNWSISYRSHSADVRIRAPASDPWGTAWPLLYRIQQEQDFSDANTC